jgi:hypothetical protein
LSRTGSLLFEISAESICEMLKVQQITDGQVLNEEALAIVYKELNLHDKQALILSLMEKDNNPPEESDNYETVIFSPISQQIINMACVVLGYDSDRIVDNTILGLFKSIFPLTIQPIARFHFAQYIANSLHYQLTKFTLSRSCRYQSYLVYLILFFKENELFKFELRN